jgi:GNAT superfamily N-acetyltransferase
MDEIVLRPAQPGDGDDLARGELRVVVDALGVEERYRRRGVATRLMQAVEGWGREQGATLVSLETDIASPVSMPFYERRMAYQKRAVIFQKRLR